jgi:hypothetical protein
MKHDEEIGLGMTCFWLGISSLQKIHDNDQHPQGSSDSISALKRLRCRAKDIVDNNDGFCSRCWACDVFWEISTVGRVG